MQSSSPSKLSALPTKPGQGQLAEYRAAYERADAFCKEVQAFVDQAGIPAINELRYAGHHLLYALDDTGSIADPHNLTKAHNHVQRACYEAGEAGILFALDRIRVFKEDYRKVSVAPVIPHYNSILEQAQSAKRKIVAARLQGTDRTSDHSELIEIFRNLSAHCNSLELSRSEMNKVIDKETRDLRRFIIGTTLSFAAIMAMALFAFWHS